MTQSNTFGVKSQLTVGNKSYTYYSLPKLEAQGFSQVSTLPISIKVLLENLLRTEDGIKVTPEAVKSIANWDASAEPADEIAFTVARVLLQDFTGVPAVVDLAAMRDSITEMGGNPKKINPTQQVDLVIDHSVQVDEYGTEASFLLNKEQEYERNVERYEFLRWGQKAFNNFRVVPPGTGICHQVNIEYLAGAILAQEIDGELNAFPDTLVGTDSHTTMANCLGIVGWGVGGIEAEASMLGQPISMLVPNVVGFELKGTLKPGTTATDLVLTVVQMLRKKGVVGKFVEFYGEGMKNLSVADRATISNMGPEYGATIGFFPVDEKTLDYLRFTGRDEHHVQMVEAYCKAQGLFYNPATTKSRFSDTLSLDMGAVVPSLAGPKRPQDRIPLTEAKTNWQQTIASMEPDASAHSKTVALEHRGEKFNLTHGDVVIAAITSCTNTSNPSVMVAAGLVARKAAALGLTSKPWVKTSLAPGSKVVTRYLAEAGLDKDLDALGFNLVGYGCTTCIGNSGPLPQNISQGITDAKLVVTAVLSGNRNFEGRISQDVRANYLASPPLVVAYAIAGTMNLDIMNDPLTHDAKGNPVYLKDIWPTHEEVEQTLLHSLKAEMFKSEYANVFEGDKEWRDLPTGEGQIYDWQPKSTYVRRPTFFEGLQPNPAPVKDIHNARCLAVLGDSVTTDHISPAGNISKSSPAARYLIGEGVEPKDFNSYGARRGNHEVMMRGTFANIRLRNQLIPGSEGGVSLFLPTGEQLSIYDTAVKYKEQNTPLVILAGKEYGSGSSRDWAAKGTRLLGVTAVLAESFERIHRSNLIGMGVLPLQYLAGADAKTLGLTGREFYSITGIEAKITTGMHVTVTAKAESGEVKTFQALLRIDTPNEVDYYRHGGILQFVLRQLALT